jgi:glycosyl transferase family 25
MFVFVLRTSDRTKYSKKGDGSIHAYLINLDHSTDRLAHIVPKLEKLGIDFTRIPAIYGKDISDEKVKELKDEKACSRFIPHAIGRGQIALYLSDLKVWKIFLKSNHSYALVFEDDADFDPQRLGEAVNLLIKEPKLWDIVSFDFLIQKKTLRKLSKLGNSQSCISKFRVQVECTACSLINRRTAIKYVRKALPFKMPVDHYCFRPWEFGIKLRTVLPRLVCQKSYICFKSEIDQLDNRASHFNFQHRLFSKINCFMMRYFSK